MTQNELLDSFVWVELKKPFLTVRETLSRIGIASRKDNTLYQSAHILHKKGRYAIVHFKQMFALDGKETDFSDEDKKRLNRIIWLLVDWKLIELIGPESQIQPMADMSHIKVIAYKDKDKWQLVEKYQIGAKKPRDQFTS